MGSLPTRMRAGALLKHNVETLLKERRQTDSELARYCRRSRSWISKLLSDRADRNVQMKYLDLIAEFFGIATYQLLQPGISPLTERRSGAERRRLRDRRISAAMPVSQRPGDVDLMDIIRALSREGREKGIQILGDILSDEIQRLRTRPPSGGAQGNTDGIGEAVHAPPRGRRRKSQA